MSPGPDDDSGLHAYPIDPDVEPEDLPPFGTRLAALLRSRWDVLLAIGCGGAVGSLARWGLATAWPPPAGGFPWPTFTVNVVGGLLLGVLMVFVTDVWPGHRHLRPFLGVGVLGGFTTFSTYMLDTRSLLTDGHAGTALLYVAATLVVGLPAVLAGLVLTRRLVVR